MREVHGPNPHEFAIIEKSHRRTQTASKSNATANNEFLKDLEATHKWEKSERIKTEYFRELDKKANEKRIRLQVENIMEGRNFLLYERRKKLRDLLENEQKALEDEFVSRTLTSQLERASVLREKANEIRRKREAEQAALVEAKLDQKWRSENDELRNFYSKQLQAGMGEEHLRQIEEKILKERNKIEEEAMFADLWYQDINAKKEREDREKHDLDKRNREVNDVLKQQMKVLDDQKIEERKIRNENAKSIKDMLYADKVEKNNQRLEKLQNQESRRKELDLCIKAKSFNQDRLAQEEMSYDLKVLEDALQSYQNEDQEKFQRKKELFEEQKMYRDYLRNMREDEKLKEKELNEYVNKEINEQFQKRVNQWKKEKENRKKLLQTVLDERGMQVNDKILKSQEEQEELARERDYVRNLANIYKDEDNARRLKAKEQTRNYRDDLIQQIDYLQGEKNAEREREALDYESNMRNEINYQNRVVDNKRKILAEYKRI